MVPCRMEEASSVETAMLVQQCNGIVHLTVSPLIMSEIGERELDRPLLRQHPAIKRLFVSGYDEETIQHHRMNQRFVLQQPSRQAGLIQEVRGILDVV